MHRPLSRAVVPPAMERWRPAGIPALQAVLPLGTPPNVRNYKPHVTL